MTPLRRLHLGINVTGVGGHNGAWRRPTVDPASSYTVEFFSRTARLAERGLFDAFFLADVPRLAGDYATQPPGQSFDPVTVLGAVARDTERIGLVATVSTTWHHPYELARALLTLDRVSHGRAGWNIVTNHTPEVALSHGLTRMPDKAARYARADEFVDLVLRLWRTWAPDAVIADKATGVFADPARVRTVDFTGEHFAVKGGSTVPSSPQGHPVLVQAGASPEGIELATRYADAVFAATSGAAVASDYAARLRAAATRAGRRQPPVLVLPGVALGLASTDAEAVRRREELDALGDITKKVAFLAGRLGVDPEVLELDAPVPLHHVDVAAQAQRNSEGFLISTLAAARSGRTVREIIAGGAGHYSLIGSPEKVADTFERWFKTGDIDGFNLMFDVVDEGLPLFVAEVVPLLQERGLFRTAYEGTTLRSHLGLRNPEWPR
ncbi:NtaA/DmoA family FMN-dependent monooxygenase [Actinacidiphila sp. ITFR-21]|uniref:NtaA/DmoA family FMN-dependent monooxygenase n=1 Tax=Actinacidiphila sp. ITFR-21 TaxID=3075199 RepID=UPI00288A5110|nr:NtaA/DmoA family FMN-dependent monooxygenase [Streptomyces sp. ITFR-21]WNI14235.1 NtaA/DmoA family FMN-dependent monooxygenase [Streptomyces sp. ITFR-21]